MRRLFSHPVLAAILLSVMTPFFIPTANAFAADAEIIRTQLVSVLRNQQALAAKLGDTASQIRLADMVQQINIMLPEALLVLQGADLVGLDQAISNVNFSVDQDIAKATVPPFTAYSLPLPVTNLSSAPYSAVCAAGSRSVDQTAINSEIALFVAEGVRDIASRACDQVVVVAGVGSNTSAVCILTDAAYVAAKLANYIITQCDGKVDSSEILGTYNRTGDIYTTIVHNHTDLMTELAAVNQNGVGVIQNGLDIAAHDVGINAALAAQNGVQAAHNAALAAHDVGINAALAAQNGVQAAHNAALGTHDGDIKAVMGAQSAALATHDLDMKAGLSLHDVGIKATIDALRRNLTIRMNILDGAVAALNPQNQTPPQTLSTINLALNARSFTTGSVLTLTGTTQASVPPVQADTYLALRLPDQTLVTMQADGSFGPGFSPFQNNLPVSNFTSSAVNYTFKGTEQAGTYTLIAFLAQPGTLIPIGAWVQASFSFAP